MNLLKTHNDNLQKKIERISSLELENKLIIIDLIGRGYYDKKKEEMKPVVVLKKSEEVKSI